MTTSVYGLAALGLLAALIQGPAWAGSLVPPPGYYAEAQRSEEKAPECEPAPKPYTGKLEFPSKFEGSDSARDDLNPKAHAKYKEQTSGITAMEKGISDMVRDYLHSGRPEIVQCALGWLEAWSEAEALQSRTSDHTGKSVRKWALSSLASAYLRLKFSASRPLEGASKQTRQIEAWFADLAKIVVNDWKDQPLNKINNHEYWAAWAVMAAAVVLDRRDLFDWPVRVYQTAAQQVDAEGYLPNELARDTRALYYHNYSLPPLAMMAAFAKANGLDLAGEGDRALQRLALRVLKGVDDPAIFKSRTGHRQVVDELGESSKFAWMEPYCWVTACDGTVTRRLSKLRPIGTYRLGGNVTELFAQPRRAQTGRRASGQGLVERGLAGQRGGREIQMRRDPAVQQ